MMAHDLQTEATLRAEAAEAEVERLRAKLQILDPNNSLCLTCGCTDEKYNTECECQDQLCECWIASQL